MIIIIITVVVINEHNSNKAGLQLEAMVGADEEALPHDPVRAGERLEAYIYIYIYIYIYNT